LLRDWCLYIRYSLRKKDVGIEMNFTESLPIILLILSFTMSVMVVLRAWRYRSRHAVKAFLWLMGALVWWLLCSILENTSTTLAHHVFWMNMSYVGICALPVMWLVFTMHYTERGKWWRRRGLPLLFIMPAITITMVWTNGLHHMMWNDIQLDASIYPPLKVITFNTWFWIHALYSYLLLLAGTINLFNLYSRTSGIYRKHVKIMLLAAFIPWIANFLFIAGIGPTFAVDPTPMAFAVTSIAFIWGLSRAHLLNIMPVAYEAIFKSISDGVIVIDERNRIKEYNPAAARILNMGKDALRGKKLCQVIPGRAYFSETISASGLNETVISLGQSNQSRFYRMNISRISDRRSGQGRLVLLHDDTERRKAENESREKTLLKTELNERKKVEQFQRDENYVLTLLGQGAELKEILDAIVRLGEANNPGIRGSVLLHDKSQGRLYHASGPSLPVGYTSVFKDGLPVGPNMGTCGTAAYYKKRVVAPDIQNSPLFAGNEDAIKRSIEHNLLACWSQPIIDSSGEVLGTIAHYNNKVGDPTEDDLMVMEWSARIAAIAIEHRRSEEALADEAVRRRILVEQSLDGIVVLDVEAKVYEANQRFAEMLGYTIEEVRELHTWDWDKNYPPEELLEMGRNVDENGLNLETKHHRKDGSVIDVDISINGAEFAGQKLIFCVSRDITERKRAEAALADEGVRRRILVEQSSDGIVVVDENGKVYEANQRFAEMLGYSMEEVRDLSIWDWEFLYPPEQVAEMIRTVDEKGDHFETQHRRKDGTIYDVEISTNGAAFAGQKLIFCVCRDITERKLAEAALKNNEERFRLLADNSTDLISLIQLVPEVRTDYVSPSCGRILGYKPEEFYADPKLGLEMIHPEDREYFNKAASLENKGPHKPISIRIVRKDGGIIHVEQTHTMIFNEQGEPVAMHVIAHDVTERVKAESALRESEEKFSKAFRSSPESISITNLKDGRFIEVNDGFIRDKGYSRKEIIGHTSAELSLFINPHERDNILKTVEEKGQVRNLQVEYHTKSGAIRTGLLSAEIITLNDEPCLIMMNNDITERRRVEDALRESEEKFSRAFRRSPNSISITTLKEGIFLEINDSFTRDNGWTRQETIGHSSNELNMWVNPEQREMILKKLRKDGQVVNLEYSSRTKAGEVRTMLFSAEPITVNGKGCIIAVTTDITERHRMEDALRESEEKFSHAFHGSPESMTISSIGDGTFIEVNESYARLTGYSREELIGHNVTDFSMWADDEQREKIVPNIRKQTKMHNEELLLRTKSGEIITLLYSTEYVHIGGELCLLSVCTDITERKRAEEELKKTGARLEAANKELEAFSYSVSHDLRSPLRSIDGFSQALLEDYTEKLDETAQDYLKRLRNASQKMGELIDGILKLSRLTRGEMQYEKVNLSELAQEITTRLQEGQPERKVKFVITKDLTARGDVQLLRALMENLLGNAWKFTGKSPRAHIEFGLSQNGDKPAFFIKDNGAGFDMNYADKLFNVFQRLHSEAEFPGTGIGLATVQRIINRHGGTIRAEGEAGKGATFYFTLD